MRSRARAARGAALALALAAGAAHGAEPVAEDPPLCQQALAAHPDQAPLAALARAEQDAAMRAARAGRDAAKRLRAHIGDGAQGALAASDSAEALLRQQADARREGKLLCHCRQRRGDPDRSDCEFLYPERLQ